MKVIQSPSEMAARADALRREGKAVGLVPCLGGIHAGKESVIRSAAAGRAAVVTLFANPLQLGPNETSARYEARREEDLRRCEAAGANTVFAPSLDEVFPRGYGTYVTEETISKRLCGISRPNHFRGVTTFAAYLLNLVRPDAIYYGQKTVQRAAVVGRMAQELRFAAAIEIVPTVREPDGLAAGFGNETMTATHRESSLALSRALGKVKEMVSAGVTSPDRVIAEATHILSQQRRVRVIYVSVVDRVAMEAVREIVPGKCLAAVAAWVDELRLIDNVPL